MLTRNPKNIIARNGEVFVSLEGTFFSIPNPQSSIRNPQCRHNPRFPIRHTHSFWFLICTALPQWPGDPEAFRPSTGQLSSF